MGRKAGKTANNRMPAATRRRGRHPKTNRQRARPQRRPVEISGRRKAGRGTNPVPPSFCVRARVRESGSAGVRARAREREHTGVFRMRTEAQRENARVSECAGGFVQMARNRTFRGGSRYIGEAENGRKLNLPSLDPLDSILSDSESSISCPKSSHEQVEKLGKFEILSKIRARLFRDSESSKSCPPPDEKSQRRAFGAFLAGPSSRSALRGIG